MPFLLRPCKPKTACIDYRADRSRPVTTTPMEDCLARLGVLILRDDELAARFAATIPEFYGPPNAGTAAGVSPDVASRRRHLEWFVCESAGPDGPTIDLLRAQLGEASGLEDEGTYRALRDSHTGVFEVTGVKPGEGFWLRDLGSLGEYPIREASASTQVQTGDVIAGRLFPLGDADHALAHSSIVRRSPTLAKALRADLDEARKVRRGVVRIGGSELEAMFAGAVTGAAEAQDAIAEARKLLHEGGIAPLDIERWLQDLADAPFDAKRIVHGADDALAPILDALAFDTSVDLDAARKVLITAWHALSTRGPGTGKSVQPTPPPRAGQEERASTDVETALKHFQAGTREGRPLTLMLDELERDLGLAAEPDEDELAPAPDFPGVVGAMIVEFLWETAQEHGPARAAELRILESLGESAREVGVFENLSARDLARWAGVYAVDRGVVSTANDAQQLVAALRKFCRWAREVHEIELGDEGEHLLKKLDSELPRIAEANARRTRASEGGELAELLTLEVDGKAEVRYEGSVRTVRLDVSLVPWLKAGDMLRGRPDDEGRFALYSAHPSFRT